MLDDLIEYRIIESMDHIQYKMISNIGPLYLVSSSKGLTGIFWTKQKFKLTTQLDLTNKAHQILDLTHKQLTEYFCGQRTQFKIPLDLKGTDFQIKVWKKLLRIPFGKTISYKDLAMRIKNPKAVRAVGTANGKNPICIVIPCHRVIANNGLLGGYSGGLFKKQFLLKIEKSI